MKAIPDCRFLAAFLVGVSLGTAATAQVVTAFPPALVLDDFYGLRGSGWTINEASIQGRYLVLQARRVGSPEPRFAMWVQDLGSDGVLTASDLPSVAFVGDFFLRPVGTIISRSGFLAFVIEDHTTADRTLPYDPLAEVPMDVLLVTCHHLDAASTLQVHERFRPRAKLNAVPPISQFVHDGAISGMLWDSPVGGGDRLLYSYTQNDNPFLQSLSVPWVTPVPMPVPPAPSPHTAVMRFDPSTGLVTALRNEPTGGLGASVFSLVLSRSLHAPSTAYSITQTTHSGGSLQSVEYGVLALDTSPAPLQPFVVSLIASWTQFLSGTPGFHWASDTLELGLAVSSTPQNGTETIVLARVLERESTPSLKLRDVVFRSSLTAFAGHDLYLDAVADARRDASKILLLDRAVPQLPANTTSFMVAIESREGSFGDPRTDVYAYRPSLQSGVAGHFELHGTVRPAADESFQLQSGTGEYLIGVLTHPLVPLGPLVSDIVLVHCP